MKLEFTATITVKTPKDSFTPYMVETVNGDNLMQLSSSICLCLIRISEKLANEKIYELKQEITNLQFNIKDDDIPF